MNPHCSHPGLRRLAPGRQHLAERHVPGLESAERVRIRGLRRPPALPRRVPGRLVSPRPPGLWRPSEMAPRRRKFLDATLVRLAPLGRLALHDARDEPRRLARGLPPHPRPGLEGDTLDSSRGPSLPLVLTWETSATRTVRPRSRPAGSLPRVSAERGRGRPALETPEEVSRRGRGTGDTQDGRPIA